MTRNQPPRGSPATCHPRYRSVSTNSLNADDACRRLGYAPMRDQPIGRSDDRTIASWPTGAVVSETFPPQAIGCKPSDKKAYNSLYIRLFRLPRQEGLDLTDALFSCNELDEPLIDFFAKLGGYKR
ncbi:MAG TPA: hypothetical protein VKQ27_20505 [Acetobacteraceae bacterium]|nr:hypothetical protein [Acetobacteraceae bacterium]